jgi:phenylalanyl-tRNA synthetase alpha chain
MKEQIHQLIEEVKGWEAHSDESLDAYRRRFTNKKGIINQLFADFRELSPEAKKETGKLLNDLKTLAFDKLKALQDGMEAEHRLGDRPHDLTLPGDPFRKGGRHPLSLVRNKIVRAFEHIGFTVAEGPEIEDDWHNFSALNFEDNHPARDMQDTFFISLDPDWLLRTHTSNVQIRVMEKHKPPIRILAPGRVYRNEAISARTGVFFHQIEGLYVDKNVSFADLKQVLLYFSRQLFGGSVEIRLRPSYFPFTEISGEMDISCLICKGDGCTVCKHSGWVEILGCGMVDPNVLENCGIDPDVYSGYAFGMGVERIAQLLYRVPDLRMYSQNDIRFLELFGKMDL